MSNDTAPASRFGSPKFVVAAAIVGIIVLLGVFLAGAALFGDDDADTTPSARSTPSATDTSHATAAPDNQPSICGLNQVQMRGTLVTPPPAEWSLHNRIALPKSATAGPGLMEASGLRHCFARTPEGALFATANYFGLSTDHLLLGEIAKHVVVEGPGRDKIMQVAPSLTAKPDDGTRAQITGFRIHSYDGNKATIDLSVRVITPDGATRELSYIHELTWISGDWKIAWAENGGILHKPERIVDRSVYTPWGGA